MAMAEMMLTLRQSHEKKNKFKIVGPALSDSLEPLAPGLLNMIWLVKVYFIGTILVMLH